MARFFDSSLRRVAVVALLFTARSALAEPAPAPPPAAALPASKSLTDSLSGTAKTDYDAAKILYEDGDYQGALLKLKASYEVAKDPRLLWNMAACEKNLRHYAEVARLVDRYLAEGAALVSEQDRAEATTLVTTVRAFVTDLTVDVDQPDATVLVDDKPIGKSPLPKPVQVDMGPRRIRVTKAGFLDFNSSPELPGGQAFHVAATLIIEKHEGRLRILAEPSDVIQVDRSMSKVGLWEGTLPSGTHSVYVSAKGKRPHQTDVIVQDNDLTNLHITLEDETKPALVEKSGIPTWVWIAGGAVLLGGGVGSYLLLKPDSTPKYQSPTAGTWGTIPI